MLGFAILCFLVAALGGLVMAYRIFRGEFPPAALAGAHGVLGALGLVLVLVAVFQGAGGLPAAALVVLLVAALGGFYLLGFHVRKQLHPKAVVVIHALIAVVGVALLLGAVLGFGS